METIPVQTVPILDKHRSLFIIRGSFLNKLGLASAHAKARLSDFVEAEPDCEIAMDILSYALYHEKGSGVKSPSTEDVEHRPAEVSDEGETEDSDSEEPVSKKQRTDGSDEAVELKSRLWDEITANDGEAAIVDLCTDASRDEVNKALEALVGEGRVHIDEEGNVYSIA